MSRPRLTSLVAVVGLLAGGITLAVVTPEQLEQMPPLCLWSWVLGRPCPGCGTTRALCSLAHGDLGRALEFNKNVLIVAPLLVWVGVGQVRHLIRSANASRAPLSAARLSAAARRS